MKKLLLIEDDKIVGSIYRNKFQIEGFQVEWATDGKASLETLEQFRPEVVVVDLNLPEINGVEIVQHIRMSPKTRDLPVIVLTNAYLGELVEEAWKAGANQCLTKLDSTPRKVVETVRSVMQQGKAPQETESREPGLPEKGDTSADRGHGDPQIHDRAAIRRQFLEQSPVWVSAMRNLWHSYIRPKTDSSQETILYELYQKVRFLAGSAAVAEARQIAWLATALEALLKELHEKPKKMTASTMRTVAQTLDFLGDLLRQESPFSSLSPAHATVLVVDDELFARKAIAHALEKADLIPIKVDDPMVASRLLADNRFDMLITDLNMPGMNGFELLNKLRELPEHARTPAIVVTGLGDFETRTKFALSSGSDFIVKPFLYM